MFSSRIDYLAAASSDLRFVPAKTAYAVLADDNALMLDDDAASFDVLMEGCAAIEERANAAGSRSR